MNIDSFTKQTKDFPNCDYGKDEKLSMCCSNFSISDLENYIGSYKIKKNKCYLK